MTQVAVGLRAFVALVLAGMAAEGTTAANRLCNIDCRYERIEDRLAGLGAGNRRVGVWVPGSDCALRRGFA